MKKQVIVILVIVFLSSFSLPHLSLTKSRNFPSIYLSYFFDFWKNIEQQKILKHNTINQYKSSVTRDKNKKVTRKSLTIKNFKKDLFINYSRKLLTRYPNLDYKNSAAPIYTELFFKIIKLFPSQKTAHIKNLIIKNDVTETNRGLAGGDTIIINTFNLSINEFSAVTIHELCHLVDLGGLISKNKINSSPFIDGQELIFWDDPSSIFYNISWINSDVKKYNANRNEYVSGYAETNPFEDLAESCTYYVLHNQEFKLLSRNNYQLKQKYEWIKKYIFDGQEFETGKDYLNINNKSWDITKLPYNMIDIINI